MNLVPASADHCVRGEFYVAQNFNGWYAALTYLADTTAATFYMARLDTQTAVIQLYETTNGTSVLMDSVAIPGGVPAAASTYWLEIGDNGQSGSNRAIEVRYGPTEATLASVLRVPDNSITAGRAGIRWTGGNGHRLAQMKVIHRKRMDSVDWGAQANSTPGYLGAGHSGNGLRRPEQIEIRDGALVLTAESKRDAGTRTVYAAGVALIPVRRGVSTRYEVDIKLDGDATGQVSGLALTWPESPPYVSGDAAHGWPIYGENDFYESGVGRGQYHAFYHTKHDTNPVGGVDRKHSMTAWNTDLSQWHSIRFDRLSNRVITSVKAPGDSTYVLRDDWTDPAGLLYNGAHFLALQVDYFPAGTPVDITTPVRMYVRNLRIYSLSSTAPTVLTATSPLLYETSPPLYS
jgi:hypothetical protein